MSDALFKDLKIYCPICTRNMGFFGPKMRSQIFSCPNCKSKFQLTSDFKDWEVGGESNKKGLSFSFGLSATVNNEVDREKLKEYNSGYSLIE